MCTTVRNTDKALEIGTVARCTAPLDPGFRRDDDGCAQVSEGRGDVVTRTLPVLG